jgi:hypothetical protein
MVPFPVPLPPEVSEMTDGKLLVTTHGHPAPVVRFVETAPPALVRVKLCWLRLKPQEPSACVIVTVWPLIVTVAVRVEPVELLATWTVTGPLPVPDTPVVTVAHAWLLDAVHAQPLGATTPSISVEEYPGRVVLPGSTA